MRPLSRRALLGALIASALGASSRSARGHSDAGVVDPPLSAPPVGLTMDDGGSADLRGLLLGKVSAVQLMFTSCRATCPIQGAVFAQGIKLLGDRVKDAQWISLSIDPGRDDPAALRAWLDRFGAHRRWRAGRPDPRQMDALVEFLKARNPGPDRHTGQVYFFDRRGALALRSVDFPPAAEIVRLLEALARRA